MRFWIIAALAAMLGVVLFLSSRDTAEPDVGAPSTSTAWTSTPSPACRWPSWGSPAAAWRWRASWSTGVRG